MVPGVFLAIEQFPVVFQFLIQNSQTAFHLLHFLQGPLPLCLHDLIAFCKRSVALLIEGAARGRFVLPADFLQTFSMDFSAFSRSFMAVQESRKNKKTA